jgi:hypothetical protein
MVAEAAPDYPLAVRRDLCGGQEAGKLNAREDGAWLADKIARGGQTSMVAIVTGGIIEEWGRCS